MCKTAMLAVTIVLVVVAVVVIIASSVLLARQMHAKKQRQVPSKTAGASLAAQPTGCKTGQCANAAPLQVGPLGQPLPPPTTVTVPVCDPLPNVPPYELTGTWYGIAGNTKPVASSVFFSNFQVLQHYFNKPNPVMPWSGFLVHLDTPAAPSKSNPAPYSNDIGLLASLIAGFPGSLRIGFELDPAQDSTWQISPSTVYVPTTLPGYDSIPYTLPPKLAWFLGGNGAGAPGPAPAAPTNPNIKFYGGPGAALIAKGMPPTQNVPAASVDVATGFPYQYPIAPCWNGFNSCPYKPTSDKNGCTDGKSIYTPPCGGVPLACDNTDPTCPVCDPDGCPGNFGRIAWYVCAVNDIIRKIGAAKQAASPGVTLLPPPVITMMAYETESSGSLALACGLFQFGFGMQQFGTPEDCFPTHLPPFPDGTPRVDTKFRVYVNGGTNLGPATIQPSDPCFDWANVPIADQAQYPGKTYGDMLAFKGSGEYYWIDGAQSDAGNVGGGGRPGAGLAPVLLDQGFIGCPQSGPGKQYFDDKCGCRSTVYNAYSKVDNGGTALMGVLGPLFDQFETDITQTAPVFSIEHLGSDANPMNFATCVNSHNFYKFTDVGPDPTGTASCWGCFKDTGNFARCGIFNGFGGWTETCMKQFLEAFILRYAKPGATSRQEVVVYDMGFLPPSWFAPADVGYERPAAPWDGKDDQEAGPLLCNGAVGLIGTTTCVPTTCSEISAFSNAPCGFTCPGVTPGKYAPFVPPPASAGGGGTCAKKNPGDSTCATGTPCSGNAACQAIDPASYCNKSPNGTCH